MSSSSSSSSSDESYTGDSGGSAADMVSSPDGSSSSDGSYTTDDSGWSGAKLPVPDAEHFASHLRTKDEVDAVCDKYGVPKEFTALPAGDGMPVACSPPPPGAVCVYEHALAAGMRVPLHPFFCEVLGHFGLAPGQLAPNGWRILVAFAALCRHAGVPPKLPVFRYIFSLSLLKFNGWYCFRGRRTAAGASSRKLFTVLHDRTRYWKERFFFLSSPAPWPCPVRWGEPPSESSIAEPVLTGEDKNLVAKLLDAHGSPVDLLTFLRLRESNIAGVVSPDLVGASPAPPPSVYELMMSMRAEKAAAQGSSGTEKKMKLEEANADEGTPRSHVTLPAPRGCSASGPSVPPGFSTQKPRATRSKYRKASRRVSDQRGGAAAVDWKAARRALQGIVTPSRKRKLASSKPADVVASTYASMLQTANKVAFSLGHALELEDKLRARKRVAAAEASALREELREAKAELALTRAAARSAAVGAVEEYLRSDKHARALAEHALEGYERGMDDMKRVALRCYPDIDAAGLVVPPTGPN